MAIKREKKGNKFCFLFVFYYVLVCVRVCVRASADMHTALHMWRWVVGG